MDSGALGFILGHAEGVGIVSPTFEHIEIIVFAPGQAAIGFELEKAAPLTVRLFNSLAGEEPDKEDSIYVQGYVSAHEDERPHGITPLVKDHSRRMCCQLQINSLPVGT